MNLPSKKILQFALALGIIGLFTYFFAYKAKKETYTAPLTVQKSKESPLLAKDSDGDGLKDWEEQLWKTDPLKSDTDGDGTQDGAEIKSGRNPTIAGPNDKLDLETVANKINTETEGDLSETDKFSRDLFLKIIAAKKANTPPTEEELAGYLNTTITQEVGAQVIHDYTESDLTVTKSETSDKISLYGNQLAEILTRKPAHPLEHELVVVYQAQEKNDPAELERLDPLYEEYIRIKSDLLSLTVPKSAVPSHLALINSTVRMAWSIDALRYILTDPIRAIPGVSAYDKNTDEFLNSIRRFRVYFKSENIEFSAGDRGYNFFDTI